MPDPDDRTPLWICTSCGVRQPEPRHLCFECGAPLTPHGSTDPILGIQSRGFAVFQATHAPQKPIVVIGMWLWMTPLLLVGLGISFASLGGVFEGLTSGRADDLFLLVPVLALGLGITWLAGTILYRTTCRYLEGRQSRAFVKDSSDEDDEDSAGGERLECLSCGQVFLGSASRCPACGWSYSS